MWYFRILFPSTSASHPPTHVRSSHMSYNISLRNSINHISLGKFESISIHKRSNSSYDMANFSVQFGFVLNLPRSNSTFPSIRKRFTRPSRNSIPQNLPRLFIPSDCINLIRWFHRSERRDEIQFYVVIFFSWLNLPADLPHQKNIFGRHDDAAQHLLCMITQ